MNAIEKARDERNGDVRLRTFGFGSVRERLAIAIDPARKSGPATPPGRVFTRDPRRTTAAGLAATS